MACASSANVCSVSTGPKTSRWTISLSFDAGSISVGSTCSVSPTRCPPRTMWSPCWRARSTNPLDPRHVVGVDHRGDRRRRVAAVAEHVAVDGGVEAARGTRRGPRPRRAAGCRRGRPDPSRRTGRRPSAAAASRSASANTISGPLPPSSAVNGTMFSAAARPMMPGRLGRPGEADPLDPRVADERRADLLADALDEVEHAGREPGLDRQVGEQRARQRRPLGRLEDHRCCRRRAPGPPSTSRA